MDQHDSVIARAQEIVGRRRQEEIEDNDIQSDELSVLASGIFDGIGMEMDIDNTGEGTGDGDEDSNEGGNGEGNSDGMVGIISPRHTRSGRIR